MILSASRLFTQLFRQTNVRSQYRRQRVRRTHRRGSGTSAAALSAEQLEFKMMLSATQLVSTGPNGPTNGSPESVSNDGRFVVYSTPASDVVIGESNPGGYNNVYLRDNLTKTTILVSHAADSPTTSGNGNSYFGVISGDGSRIAYMSTATDLVPGTTGGISYNIYVYDVATATNTLVSHQAGSPTVRGSGVADTPRISDDGSKIAYESNSTDLVAGQTDANNDFDVFVYDVATNVNSLVSHAFSSMTTTGNNVAYIGQISGDGTTVVYSSSASNIISGTDANGASDVFIYDIATGTNTLVSHAAGSPTTACNGNGSGGATISDDGSMVAFYTKSTNVVSGLSNPDSHYNVYVYSTASNSSMLVTHTFDSLTTSANADTFSAAISGDGTKIAYRTTASDVMSGLTGVGASGSQLFLYSVGSNATFRLVSHYFGAAKTSSNGQVSEFRISDNGQQIAYSSSATDLVYGATDANALRDIFRYNVATGTSALVSSSYANSKVAGDAESRHPLISSDGTTIVFESDATNLVTNDNNGLLDAFMQGYQAPNLTNQDVAAFNSQTGQWRLGISNGSQFSNTPGPKWNSSVTWQTFTGDVNGDGFDDLIGRVTDNGQWYVAISDGAGHFMTTPFGRWGSDSSAGWQNVQAVDLNGDHKIDIIGQTSSGQWWGAISDGSRFVNQYFGRWSPTGWVDIGAGDFNGDGRTDILGLTTSGQLWVGISTGSVFQTEYAGQWSASAGWKNFLVGDINGDGADDGLAQQSTTSAWFFGAQGSNGNLATYSAGKTTQDTPFGPPQLADVNGDGLADLIVVAGNQNVFVKLSTGTGMASPVPWGTAPAGGTLIAAADVNADGLADLIFLDSSTGAWTSLLSTGKSFKTQTFGAWSGDLSGFQNFYTGQFV